MDRNGILVVLLLFLIVADVANADVAPDNSTATPVPPSTNPGEKLDDKTKNLTDPIPKGLNNSESVSQPSQNQTVTVIEKNPKEDSNKTETVPVPVLVPDSPTLDNSSNPNPENSNNTVTGNPPPEINKDDEKKNKSDDNTTSTSVFNVDQNCTGSPCRDQKLIACIASLESGSKELVVLVQNGGEEFLEVNLGVSSSVKTPLKKLEIQQHQIINISLDVGRNTEVIVNAGHWECVLHLNLPVSERTYFLRLPSYDKLVTPINGAYFLILTGIIFGGTWTCCKFRKRRRQGGVPYQELEMEVPESVSATNVETAEGWDQGWDDDWDEENAVKSPGGRHVGSISANGLTSRSLNRDGWENDWDD